MAVFGCDILTVAHKLSPLPDGLFICLLFGYTKPTDTTEAKDMATKKKQVEQDATAPVEQQLTEHQQAILGHYGPNSAEFAEAMRGE